MNASVTTHKRQKTKYLGILLFGFSYLLPSNGYSMGEGSRYAIHPASISPLFKSGEVSWETYPAYCKEHLGISFLEFSDGYWDGIPDDRRISIVRENMKLQGSVPEILLIGKTPELNIGEEPLKEFETYMMNWAEVAAKIGCFGIRIRLPKDEAIDSLPSKALVSFLNDAVDHLEKLGLSLYVENLSGKSRNPNWLIQLIDTIGKDKLHLIVDTGNFEPDTHVESFQQLLPYADRVCLKLHSLNEYGVDLNIPNDLLMSQLADSSFNGQISIECLDRSLATDLAFELVVTKLNQWIIGN